MGSGRSRSVAPFIIGHREKRSPRPRLARQFTVEVSNGVAVKIRLKRAGAKKSPSYRVVVADSRSPRDGRFIEELGYYDPTKEPAIFKLKEDRVKEWLAKGAQPSETVKALLVKAGLKKKAAEGTGAAEAAVPDKV